jgi:putative ABC transport system permease protein
MRDLWKDLTLASRMLLKTPAVTVAVIVTLAVGIAANSVAFALMNSFFIRPLPIQEPEQLVRIYSSFASGFQHFTVSYPDYADIQQLTTVFSGVMVDEPAAVSLGVYGANERLWGSSVSGNYFSVLGVKPAHGRFFSPEEASRSAGSPVVILSYGLWQRRFNGSREVLGHTVTLNGEPCTVIGIVPKDFHGIHLGLRPELWLPIVMTGRDRGARQYFATARLRPGVSGNQARASLDMLERQLQETYPDTNKGIRFRMLPESEGRVHPMARGDLLGFSGLLIVVAALMLVVACANVAGILLVRAMSRRKEIGTRLALGATRGRIIRQFLTESTLLSVLSGGVGLTLAWVVTRVMGAIHFPTRVPIYFDVGLDDRVLAFSFAVTVLAGVLFGLSPALEASKSDLMTMLREREAAGGWRRTRLRNTLVMIQVALSTALLIGAGLFLRSLQNAHRMDVGFDPEGVVRTSLDLGLQRYQAVEARQFWRRLVERLAALPGTESVSLASAVPFELNITTMKIAPEGYQAMPDGGWSVDFAIVHSGYFETLRIPLLAGRDFTERDTEFSRPVVIVNDVLARQFWPGMSAVGKSITTSEGRVREVIGVARRGKYLTLGEQPKPYVYSPLGQSDTRAMTVLIRGAGNANTVLQKVRDTIRAMDNTVPLYNVSSMSEQVNFALLPARGGATALNFVGMVALTLMALGLYGTLAHMVTRRIFEIGVRRALGAKDGHVIVLVVTQALRLVLVGLVIGIILGLIGARLLGSLLYGVEAADPLVFLLAPVVLALVSVLAAWIPTYRAVRIDPARALRYE